MRFISLFSGIEAASVAWKPLGWECAAVAEIEKFPCAVLKHHYPEVPNLGDVTKITEQQITALGHIDVVIFGFPCQDLSVAGKRKGLTNADGSHTRSGLFYYAEQIARWSKARWTVAENVPGLFSSNEGRDFAAVVGELAGAEISVPAGGWRSAGVALGPRGLIEWIVLDAQYFGLAQRRKRVFVVRDSGTQWQHRPPLFLKPPGLWRDTAPRRQTGKRVAPTLESGVGRSGVPNDFHLGGGLHEVGPTLSARTRGGGGLGTDAECDGGVIPVQEIAPTLRSGGSNNSPSHGTRSGDSRDELIVPVVAHALKAEGHDGSEDGTGRGVPLVPDIAWALQERDSKGSDSKGSDSSTKEGHLIPVAFSSKDSGADCQEDLSPTLRSGNMPAVAFQPRVARNGHGADMGDTVNCLQAASTGTSDAAPCVAFHQNQRHELTTSHTAGSLKSGGGKPGQGYPAAFVGAAVRRLTPVECARLQGFPDDYLRIHDKVADGPQYKALGNSFAVPVITWIGRRLELIEQLSEPTP